MIPPRPRDAIELATRQKVVHLQPKDELRQSIEIIVGVTAHGIDCDLNECLASITKQDVAQHRVGLILLIDCLPHEFFRPAIPEALAERTWVISANCGSAARARNTILDFVEESVEKCRWIARLDWDDRFAEPTSLGAAVDLGERTKALFVLGGNRVLSREGVLVGENRATKQLRDRRYLLVQLTEMASGLAENELPSCNLLLAAHKSIRYPDVDGAEDHRLVASLLMFRPSECAILEHPLYCDYRLDGTATTSQKKVNRYRRARQELLAAAEQWDRASKLPGEILGFGCEGIVRLHAGEVHKHFYRHVISDDHADWLERTLAKSDVIPRVRMFRDDSSDSWIARYASEDTYPVDKVGRQTCIDFLRSCLREHLVVANITRQNFRRREDGSLLYVDVGNWVLPMNVSLFRDSAARLYAIGVLGFKDDELLRRRADHSQSEIWETLDGFVDFLDEVVGDELRSRINVDDAPKPSSRHLETSLLIKACAMDAQYAREQVVHIVEQLVDPSDFAERLLLIDSHDGPFIRAHAEGDLAKLVATASELRASGVIDRVLVAPKDHETVRRINLDWFGLACTRTHSSRGIPVSPQLWAFDQVRTRYVLQCDIDVLIARRRWSHDYLGEMLEACRSDGVVSVGFNIPRDPTAAPRPYFAPDGEHKPEVRCGLFDLVRLRSLRPLPNSIERDMLATSWYNALHHAQRGSIYRSLRGGSTDTFFIHPKNESKWDLELIRRVRDLVGQGLPPSVQWEHWDLIGSEVDWKYQPRSESVVVLAKGRNTGSARLMRFARGLAMQTFQEFGVVAIDDASDDGSAKEAHVHLSWLGPRLTLIRRAKSAGRMQNNILAVREICTNPNSMIVVLDLDDALVEKEALGRIASLASVGHDVVLAAPYRPDAPTKIYRPDFRRAREAFGGDVWIHLRSFRKELFDRIPDAALQIDGHWVEHCEDYALMLPIAEMSVSPIYLPEYMCLHERSTILDREGRAEHDMTIQRLLTKPSYRLS